MLYRILFEKIKKDLFSRLMSLIFRTLKYHVSNQCPKRVIMILKRNFLIFVWVHLYPCVLQISWPKHLFFCCCDSAFSNTKKTHNDTRFSKEVKAKKYEISLSFVITSFKIFLSSTIPEELKSNPSCEQLQDYIRNCARTQHVGNK